MVVGTRLWCGCVLMGAFASTQPHFASSNRLRPRRQCATNFIKTTAVAIDTDVLLTVSVVALVACTAATTTATASAAAAARLSRHAELALPPRPGQQEVQRAHDPRQHRAGAGAELHLAWVLDRDGGLLVKAGPRAAGHR